MGCGGPSGTGKASASPVFPPPTFDEPLPKKTRVQSAILHHNRIVASVGHGPGSANAPSAASIVAGIGTAPAAPPAPHTTLTPLTPLKRAGSMPLTGKPAGIAPAPSSGGVPKAAPLVGGSSDLTPGEAMALQEQRKETALAEQKHQQREMALKNANNRKQTSSAPSSPSHSSVGSNKSSGSRGSKKEIAGLQPLNGISTAKPTTASGLVGGGPTPIGAIGGSNPIGAISGSNLPSNLPSMGSPLIGSSFSSNLGGGPIGEPPASTALNPSLDPTHTGSGILGGQPLAPLASQNGIIGGSSLSGNPFGGLGLLPDTSAGGGVDKWGAAGGSQNNMFGGSGALWGGSNDPSNRPAPIGPRNGSVGGDVGGMSLFGTSQNGFGSGSSALANMLGIELPTGSGSLRESTVPFGNPMQSAAPVGGLNANGAVGANGPIGAIGASKPNNGMMQPIGGPSQGGGGIPIGGVGFSNGNNDVALLQSLLPGVNITSGNAYRPAAPQYHGQMQQPLQQQPVGVASLNQGSAQWNGGNTTNTGAQQQHPDQQQQQRSGNTIW